MDKKEFDFDVVKTWKCPTGTGVPLITMPNVPKPLHKLNPRNLMGQNTWNHVRKKCYYDAHYKCEICGADFAEIKPRYAAHELYSYDYTKGTGKFERCIAICAVCHDAIHSGRLITMYKNGNPLYPKSYVLKVVEHCFKLVSDYNKEHEDEEPLKVYATYLEYLKHPDLNYEMVTLIAKYHMQFYAEPKKVADWSKWKLIIGKKEYPTPYKSEQEWKEAMEATSMDDTKRQAAANDPFKGGIFDTIDEMLKET